LASVYMSSTEAIFSWLPASEPDVELHAPVENKRGDNSRIRTKLWRMTDPKDNLVDYSKGSVLFTVPDECAGLRLDLTLAKLLPEYSRNRLQEWIAGLLVKVNGEFASTKQKVWGGETVEVSLQAHPSEQPHQAEDIALDIVYEDESLLVINKPAGLVVHPGSGNWQGTLLNALLHHAPQLEGVPRAGIVHRLDKETSGLLVVAKTLTAQTALVRQLQHSTHQVNRSQEQLPVRSSRTSGFHPAVSERQLAARTVQREYLALVHGEMTRPGKVEAPVGRHPTQRIKMAVVESGRPAVTHYQIEKRFPSCTLLRCRLETGRTHQIRVHMAHLKHPLVGDRVYVKGPQRCVPKLRELLAGFPRQALHATRLALVHPVSGVAMEWHAPLPLDMQQLLQQIEALANEPA